MFMLWFLLNYTDFGHETSHIASNDSTSGTKISISLKKIRVEEAVDRNKHLHVLVCFVCLFVRVTNLETNEWKKDTVWANEVVWVDLVSHPLSIEPCEKREIGYKPCPQNTWCSQNYILKECYKTNTKWDHFQSNRAHFWCLTIV